MKQLREPGVYRLSMNEYLASPAISHSMLKRMRTPAHFRYEADHPQPSTEAQIIGTVLHTAKLEPETLETSCWVRPETYPHRGMQKPWHGGADYCKAWIAEHQDRPIIKKEDYDTVIAMRKALIDHPTVSEILLQGDAEMSLFTTDGKTELPIKSRPDFLSGNTIVNLKTTEDASPEAFPRTILNFGYDSSAAFSLDVAKRLGLNKNFYLFIAIEKEAPYCIGLYYIDEESIAIGRRKYRKALDLLAHCVKCNEWPGYDPSIQPISLPDWVKRKEQDTLSLGYNSTLMIE